MYDLLCIFFVITELLSLLWCIEAFLPRRCGRRSLWIAFFFCCAADFIVLHYFVPYAGYQRSIAVLFLYFLFAVFVFRPRLKTGFFLGLLILTIYLIQYFVLLSFRFFISHISALSLSEFLLLTWSTPVCGIPSHLLFLTFSGLLRWLHPPRGTGKVPWPGLLATLLFPFTGLTVLLSLISLPDSAYRSYGALSASTILLAASNISVFFFIDRLHDNGNLREKELSLTQTISLQAQSLEALNRSYTDQRRITHDFQHHLSALSGLLENGSYDKALEYLTAVRGSLSSRCLLVNSRHPVIDAILNQKLSCAQSHGIIFHCRINDLSGLAVDPVHLSVILGNLLDNAMEACLQHHSDMQIELKLILDKSLFFCVRNTCSPVEIVNGEIESTKSGFGLHGFGLQNVKALLKLYAADYAMHYENGWFLFAGEMENKPLAHPEKLTL